MTPESLSNFLVRFHPINIHIKWMDRKLKRALNMNLKSTEETINIFRKRWEFYKGCRIIKYDKILNFSLYSAIVNSDILMLSVAIITTKQKFEKLLFSRMLYVIIIEYLDVVNTLLGKDLKGELTNMKLDKYIDEIKKFNKQFAKIKNDNEPFLREVRNKVGAHKTKDSLELINVIYNIDYRKSCELAVELSNLNNLLLFKIADILQELMQSEDTK